MPKLSTSAEYKSSIHLKFYLRLPRSRSPCSINILFLVSLLSSRSHNTRIHTPMFFLFGAHLDSREHRPPLTPNSGFRMDSKEQGLISAIIQAVSTLLFTKFCCSELCMCTVTSQHGGGLSLYGSNRKKRC